MAQKPLDLYIYLLKRDKKGVRIISHIKGSYLAPTKITDVSEFNLPGILAENLKNIISEAKLMWEPWAETTDTFINLRKSLKERGYLNVPVSNEPEFSYQGTELPVANVSRLTKQNVMLQNAHPNRSFS